MEPCGLCLFSQWDRPFRCLRAQTTAGRREEGESGAAGAVGEKLAGPALPTCGPAWPVLLARSAPSTPVLGGAQPIAEGSLTEGAGTFQAGP